MTGSRTPSAADGNLDKGRDGHRPDPLSLAHQVDEHPAIVALLDVPGVERRELAPAQCAAEQHRKDRTVPFSFGGFAFGLSEQVARLFPGEPLGCLLQV